MPTAPPPAIDAVPSVAAPPAAAVQERVALRPDARLELHDDGSAAIHCQYRRFPLPAAAPGLRAALAGLRDPAGMAVGDFVRAVTAADGYAALPRALWLMNQLRQSSLLSRMLDSGGRVLLTVVPISLEPPSPASAPPAEAVLSRFALLRREGAAMVVESPLSHVRVVVNDPALVPLLALLAAPATAEGLAARLPELEPAAVVAALAMLHEARLLAGPDEDEAPLRAWDVHDLYFHSRSRRGRHANPYGGTFRHAADTPPALKPAGDGPLIPLETPDPDAPEGPSLEAVLAARRSLRRHHAEPITRRQLGEFLYRAARVVERASTHQGEWTRRRYPAGGGLYELEVYPVVGACAGLEPGLYHYRPEDHALSLVRPFSPEVRQLVAEAALTSGQGEPHVLLVIAARFARLSSKYESLAYALCLKDTGVLMQTMYLVATAMELAPCALGGGDSDLFARASGLPWLVEGSVGEFLLGVPTDDGADAPGGAG